MNASIDEPTIPSGLRRPLAAVWISLGLHAALIALVHVAPSASTSMAESVIEARLVSTHAAPAAKEIPSLAPAVDLPDDIRKAVPLRAPSAATEALPVAAVPAEPAQSVATLLPEAPPAGTPQGSAPPSAPAPAPAAVITSSVDLTYYSAREVDIQPRALREIVPDYPADADRQRLSGKVRLQLKLEADGRVSDLEIVQADPPDVFNDSALRALREARFAPAQRNGRPVRARVLIEVVYDWEGRR